MGRRCSGGYTAIPRSPTCTDRSAFWEAQEEIYMSFDDLLIALIIAGFGFSGAYFRAEYLSWRRCRASERKRETSFRELHATQA